jgi:general secretion pathway protein J
MKQQGFTLFELLVASIIFAIMAVMAYGGLENIIDNSESSEQALKRLKQIQQGVSVLNRDFTQIIPRGIRDEYGNKQPYLLAGNNIENLVEFTRGGQANPANMLRSSLLRVAYRFEDENLIRLHWPQLDRSQTMEPLESTLIDNIESV